MAAAFFALTTNTFHFCRTIGFCRAMATAVRAPLVVAPKKKHTATVILLHGLGDSGEGWLDVAEMFAPKLPHIKFILPNAPVRPITLNGGYAMPGWYDILTLNRGAREDEVGIKASAEYVRGLIQAEMDVGIPSTRVVLAGFSQGAAMSLYTALTTNVKIAGVVAMSGYLLQEKTITAETVASSPNKDTPILMCHGDVDPVVRYAFGKGSFEYLQTLRPSNLDFKTYKGMGHSACPEELEDVAAFIAKVVS